MFFSGVAQFFVVAFLCVFYFGMGIMNWIWLCQFALRRCDFTVRLITKEKELSVSSRRDRNKAGGAHTHTHFRQQLNFIAAPNDFGLRGENAHGAGFIQFAAQICIMAHLLSSVVNLLVVIFEIASNSHRELWFSACSYRLSCEASEEPPCRPICARRRAAGLKSIYPWHHK